MTGYLRTTILMAAMTAFVGGIGWLLGGEGGLMIALLIAVGMNVFSYWNSDKIILRMYRAQEVHESQSPRLYGMTKQLAENAGLPMPRLYIIPSHQPNAFATGRNPDNAAVAVTAGLMDRLSQQEIAGVIAHELAHIKNRDTLIMTITATLAGALTLLANFALFFGGNRDARLGFIGVLALSILAPLAASIIQMAISRAREYEADRIGAEICGRPQWLASALEKIASSAKSEDNHQAEDNPATAHMFIINPLHMRSIDSLFSTHPPTEDRIRKLMSYA